MEGTIAALDRHSVTVQLDPDHTDKNSSGRLVLPAAYVGEHAVYAYAVTADSAQSTTIDHGLYAPTGFGSLERGYVALTRGAISSRIYATTNNGWRTTLGLRAAHTPALHQTPDPDHLRQHLPSVQPAPVIEAVQVQPRVAAPPAAAKPGTGSEAVAYPPLALMPPPVEPPILDDPDTDGLAREGVPAAPPASLRWLVPLPDMPPPDDEPVDTAPHLDEGLHAGRDMARRQIDPPALAM